MTLLSMIPWFSGWRDFPHINFAHTQGRQRWWELQGLGWPRLLGKGRVVLKGIGSLLDLITFPGRPVMKRWRYQGLDWDHPTHPVTTTNWPLTLSVDWLSPDGVSIRKVLLSNSATASSSRITEVSRSGENDTKLFMWPLIDCITNSSHGHW